MKLQVNTNGAWKDVIEFDAHQVAAIQSLVSGMHHISHRRSRFRITTNDIHPTSTMDQDGVWWTAAQRKEKSNVEG